MTKPKEGPKERTGPKFGDYHRQKQRELEEDRHEKAGLPRKHVEADDFPDDDGRP